MIDPMLFELVMREMDFGKTKYGAFHNSHEHYAVLQEEVDEWWEAVKGNMADCCQYELIQVAAVALRYVLENGDLESIKKVMAKRHAYKELR